MSTRVDQLSEIFEAFQQAQETEAQGLTPAAGEFEFWPGASGGCYVHSVFRLRDCPELPKACYILVNRHDTGACEIRAMGQTTHDSATLNRAQIRQQAAELGANEVHVHFLGTSYRDRAVVLFDIETGLTTAADEDGELYVDALAH
ncbi:MAG: hypothetical protein AAFQ45_12055 [Pseudomonadota bacterium]